MGLPWMAWSVVGGCTGNCQGTSIVQEMNAAFCYCSDNVKVILPLSTSLHSNNKITPILHHHSP